MGLLSTTHIHNQDKRTVYPDRINVHEHRAPTDESLRLVQEMEDKVKKKILATCEIRTGYVEAVCIYYVNRMPLHKVEFQIKFNINGKEHVMIDEVDGFEWSSAIKDKWQGFGVKAVFVAFHERLSRLIAMELMQQSPDFVKSLEQGR